jgi:hypothetical protein
MVTVSGVPLPDPAWDGYSGNTATFVDAARNLMGVTIGDVIRDDVAKVECKWSFLPAKQWADILKLFSKKRGGKFYNTVTFYCQDTADWETREMYISDRSSTTFIRAKETGEPRGFTNCRLALIEM